MFPSLASVPPYRKYSHGCFLSFSYPISHVHYLYAACTALLNLDLSYSCIFHKTPYPSSATFYEHTSFLLQPNLHLHTIIHKDITLPSPSVPCLFIGKYTDPRLPKPLTSSLSSPSMNHRDYGGRILVATTRRLYYPIFLLSFHFYPLPVYFCIHNSPESSDEVVWIQPWTQH